MKLVVTGADGLIGRHVRIHLHARQCAARHAGTVPDIAWTALGRQQFNCADRLAAALAGADAVIHLAACIRDTDANVLAINADITARLVQGCVDAGCRPLVVHASSVQAARPTAYGRAKAAASATLRAAGLPVADLVLPHVFGEGARPHYNNVTATLIDALLSGKRPTIDRNGTVELVHTGRVAARLLQLAYRGQPGETRIPGRRMTVEALHDRLWTIHERRQADGFPALASDFDTALFACYRAAQPAQAARVPLHLARDRRGDLFEAAPGTAGGHVFFSVTNPGITRGDHFHLFRVERFIVLHGQAEVSWRPVLGAGVHRVQVSGTTPEAVDIPPLATHAITNSGDTPLLTAFWTDRPFDPARPDTYFDPVQTTSAPGKQAA